MAGGTTRTLKRLAARGPWRAVLLAVLLTALLPGAQLAAQSPPGNESGSHVVSLRAQVAAPPVWSGSAYDLPLREVSESGLLVRGSIEQFRNLEPGDWVEVRGWAKAGILTPDSFQKLAHDTPPAPAAVAVPELSRLHLGQWIRTHGAVAAISERAAGRTIEIADRGKVAAVFLPRPAGGSALPAQVLRLGDRVVVTGIAAEAGGPDAVQIL